MSEGAPRLSALLVVVAACGGPRVASETPAIVVQEVPAAPPIAAVEEPARPPPSPPSLLFLPADHQVPIIVDVNADQRPDLVGLFTGEDGKIRLVAFDGASWKTLWTAGPFDVTARSRKPSLVVLDDRVVVADGGPLRVFGLRDGRPLATIASSPASEVCLASKAGIQRGKKGADGSIALGQIEASRTEVLVPGPDRAHGSIVDVVSGARRDPGNESWCFVTEIGLAGAGCARTDSDDCYRSQFPPFTTRGFLGYQTFFEGPLRVAVGDTGSGSGLGFAQGAKKAAWRRSFLLEGDTKFDGYMSHAIGEGRLYTAYVASASAEGRLVAHAIDTGAEVWRATLPKGRDAYPVGMTTTQGLVVVVMRDRSLAIHEARTGTLLQAMLAVPDRR